MSYVRSSRLGTLITDFGSYSYYPLDRIEGSSQMPLPLKVLIENIIRNVKDDAQADVLVSRVIEAGRAGAVGDEVSFSPARVLFQDFTGVPVFVDFATMREACAALGGDPSKINPQVPCDLVIDHSVIADESGCPSALEANMELEYERNRERYAFLKWAQKSFQNVRIVAPGVGICHQLNIEQFAHVVMCDQRSDDEQPLAYFDTLVGTDSHTPTANGIGVLGWGVGGIEAEAAALGQPITTLVPKVVGVKLTGRLSKDVSGMDVSLAFAEMLRKKGVVGAFVECFGEGVASLSATQRACISNMTPEYGCTCTLFPVDEHTLSYLRMTGRSDREIALVEAYSKAQGFWNDPCAERTYAEVLELDLSRVTRSIAGPSRPHDRISLDCARSAFRSVCEQRGLDMHVRATVERGGRTFELTHGALAIAAVTSCTTATDPAMMLACGLVAKHAFEAGLKPKPWVKTILAPGSHATELLLSRAGLSDALDALGFSVCGFGCMSCIGNSGPLFPEMHNCASSIELASVLSGNRNFEGRISPDVSQNYLAAPALVVAYALAGTMDFDFAQEPLGYGRDGEAVYLRDIWPTAEEIADLEAAYVTADLFEQAAQRTDGGDKRWSELVAEPSDLFSWDESSTYVRRAPYFEGMRDVPAELEPMCDARVLAKLGDFITTDHISPAGAIAIDSPAARYLQALGVDAANFNTYGSRRGNHEVMMRGTFANVKLANDLAQGRLGGWTYGYADGCIETIFEASQSYASSGEDLVVIAGKMYGSGSSRDWAAKGPKLLGVRAVFAESYERIHRSNLIGMGILPLQFLPGQNAASLGLDGSERYSIPALHFSEGLPEPGTLVVSATSEDGSVRTFEAIVRIDTPTEGEYYRNGGILPYVIRALAKD